MTNCMSRIGARYVVIGCLLKKLLSWSQKLFGVFLAQYLFVELSDAGLGQRLDKDDALRYPVSRDNAFGSEVVEMCLWLGLADRASGLDDHYRQRPLGPLGSGHANNCGLRHLRMLEKQVFQIE